MLIFYSAPPLLHPRLTLCPADGLLFGKRKPRIPNLSAPTGMKPVPAPSDSPVGVPWSPPDPVARARRTVGRLVQSGSACAHLGGSGEGRWLPGWSWGTNSVPGGKNSSLLGDGQGAGSREHPGTLESAQEGLNKVGCPTLWRDPWSWKAKHKEPVGGGHRMEQWSPQPGRNWGAPTIPPLGQELPSFLSREVPRGRNRVKMRERNLRNAEEAGWLCREAWAEGRGCLPHVGSAPQSVLCLPAGEGVCVRQEPWLVWR